MTEKETMMGSEKDVFSPCHERGTKKKLCGVSMRSRTSDLRIPSSDALPLSHRDSGEQVS